MAEQTASLSSYPSTNVAPTDRGYDRPDYRSGGGGGGGGRFHSRRDGGREYVNHGNYNNNSNNNGRHQSYNQRRGGGSGGRGGDYHGRRSTYQANDYDHGFTDENDGLKGYRDGYSGGSSGGGYYHGNNSNSGNSDRDSRPQARTEEQQQRLGQKRSRDHDDDGGGDRNGDGDFERDDPARKTRRVPSGALQTQRYDPADDSNRSKPRGRKMPGGMVEHQEEILPENVAMVKAILTRIGDFTQMTADDDVLGNILATAGAFSTEGSMSENVEDIANLFVKAFSTLSVQIPIIGTLLAVVARQSFELPSLVVSKLETGLLQSLDNGDIQTARLILRSLSVLASADCILDVGDASATTGHGIVNIFESILFAVTGNPTTFTSLSDESQVALYLLASSIPWAITAIRKSAQGKSLLTKLSIFFELVAKMYSCPFDVSGSKKSLFHAYYEIPQPDSEDGGDSNSSSNPFSHVLSIGPNDACCWDNLSESVAIALDFINTALDDEVNVFPSCMSAYWTELPLESMESRTTDLIPLTSSIKSEIAGALSRSQSKSVPQTVAYRSAPWLTPKFYLFDVATITDASRVLSCYNLSRLEKHILSTYCLDIVTFFNPVMNTDGTLQGTVDTMCEHILALNRCATRVYPTASSTSVGDDDGGVEAATATAVASSAGGGGLQLEHLICETFLQALATIPVHTIRNVSICRVLLELCKKRPSEFSPALALGALLVSQMLPSLDFSVIQEYAKWISFHLTNTNLIWPYWDHWVAELEEEAQAATADDASVMDAEKSTILLGYDSINGLFCRMIVERLTQIFLPSTVRVTLPPIIQSWVPSNTDAAATVVSFLDLGDDSEEIRSALKSAGYQLKRLVLDREANEAVEAFLDKTDDILDTREDLVEIWRSTLLFKAILMVGGQVLSVLTSLIEKYSASLRSFGQSFRCQEIFMSSLAKAFKSNGGVFHAVLDIIVRRGVIQPAVALYWILALPDDLIIGETSPVGGINCLGGNAFVYSVIETICDRSVDFVRASVSARNAFGTDMVLDESLDVSSADINTLPSSSSSSSSSGPFQGFGMKSIVSNSNNSSSGSNNNRAESVISSTGASAGGASTLAPIDSLLGADDNDNEEMDSDDEGRAEDSHRQRHTLTGSSAAAGLVISTTGALATSDQLVDGGADLTESMADVDMDPKAYASEAVISALYNSRTIYRELIKILLSLLIPSERTAFLSSDPSPRVEDAGDEGDEGGGRGESSRKDTANRTSSKKSDSENKGWSLAALSLLRKVLRTFHDAEVTMNAAHANEGDDRRIAISDISGVKEALVALNLSAEDLSQLPSVVAFRSYVE